MAKLCRCPVHKGTKARRELHPQICVCMCGCSNMLDLHSVMPGQNFLALWGPYVQRKQWLGKADPKLPLEAWPKSWPGPAFGEPLGKAYADLGSGLTPAPETGLTCPCRGTAHAIAGSWQAEHALHLLQDKALPSNSKADGSTPMDFIWISCSFSRLLHRENTLHLAEQQLNCSKSNYKQILLICAHNWRFSENDKTFASYGVSGTHILRSVANALQNSLSPYKLLHTLEKDECS